MHHFLDARAAVGPPGLKDVVPVDERTRASGEGGTTPDLKDVVLVGERTRACGEGGTTSNRRRSPTLPPEAPSLRQSPSRWPEAPHLGNSPTHGGGAQPYAEGHQKRTDAQSVLQIFLIHLVFLIPQFS